MKKIGLSIFAFLFSSSLLGLEASPHFKKVVWIVFENETASVVIKDPNFAQFAKYGALLSGMSGEVHPSQGNYIAMISGSAQNIKSDANVNLKGRHVGDLLEEAGLDWRIYAEDYPGNCFTGARSKNYVRKHEPFISFTNVSGNPKRCQKIEGPNHFSEDYNSGSLADFNMYIPNLKNDGHDTGVKFAGNWLAQKFGDVLSKPELLKDVLFILTFDESSRFSPGNKIYTVLIGSKVLPGSQNTQALDHTALLKMIEDEYEIGNLGAQDATAPPIVGIWK